MSLRFAALTGAGAFAIATGAFAQTTTQWVEAPSVADVAAAYPPRAKAARLGGSVELTCEIDHERPRQCATLGETPKGYSFGYAARRLAERLRARDDSLNGREMQLHFTFDPGVLTGAATVTRPTWAALPAPSDFQATFPQAANGVNSVRVVLACTVGAGGVLGDCAVDSEEPVAQGYGAGALALAPKFRMAPWTDAGEPTVGAHVRLPIRYELTPVKPATKP
jgi:hypothetical protein